MSLRHAIDITPWNSDGYSFWGLNRNQAKKLGLFFIFAAALFADPPGGLLPFNDLLNFWAASKLTMLFGGSGTMWIVATYTVIPLALLLVGAWIYPHNTHSILNGYVNKFQSLIKKIVTNPLLLAFTIASFVIFYKVYSTYLQGVIP